MLAIRAPDYESGGQEFESLRARQYSQRLTSISQLAPTCFFHTWVHSWAHMMSFGAGHHPPTSGKRTFARPHWQLGLCAAACVLPTRAGSAEGSMQGILRRRGPRSP